MSEPAARARRPSLKLAAPAPRASAAARRAREIPRLRSCFASGWRDLPEEVPLLAIGRQGSGRRSSARGNGHEQRRSRSRLSQPQVCGASVFNGARGRGRSRNREANSPGQEGSPRPQAARLPRRYLRHLPNHQSRRSVGARCRSGGSAGRLLAACARKASSSRRVLLSPAARTGR